MALFEARVAARQNLGAWGLARRNAFQAALSFSTENYLHAAFAAEARLVRLDFGRASIAFA